MIFTFVISIKFVLPPFFPLHSSSFPCLFFLLLLSLLCFRAKTCFQSENKKKKRIKLLQKKFTLEIITIAGLKYDEETCKHVSFVCKRYETQNKTKQNMSLLVHDFYFCFFQRHSLVTRKKFIYTLLRFVTVM